MPRTKQMTDETFRHKYDQANSVRELAQLCGCCDQWVFKRMKLLGLPTYPDIRVQQARPNPHMPDEDEIRCGCLEAQKHWSPQKREAQRVIKTQHVEIREYAVPFDLYLD